MGQRKAAHHSGQHQRLARLVVTAANANPNTRCQATDCKGWGNRTLAEHPNTHAGNPPNWTAGHKLPGHPATSIRDYQPEVNVCNDGPAVAKTHRRKLTTTRDW